MWGCRMPCHFCDTWRHLNTHVSYRFHKKTVKQRLKRQIEGVDLACTVEGCSFVSANFSTLCEHLHWHIRDGKKVSCPYTNCSKYFWVRSSFSSHLSRKHRKTSCPPCGSHASTSATTSTCASMNRSSDSELGHTFETVFDDANDLFLCTAWKICILPAR